MTGGPPAPSRHPSSRPPSLPPSISLECPDGDSAVTPHLSIPVPQMPWTQAAAKKPASSSFSFSADPGGSGRWPSGPRVAQVLPFLSAERLGVVRPRRPRALVWPALPLKCDVCTRSHFEPQPGLVEGDTCGRAPPRVSGTLRAECTAPHVWRASPEEAAAARAQGQAGLACVDSRATAGGRTGRSPAAGPELGEPHLGGSQSHPRDCAFLPLTPQTLLLMPLHLRWSVLPTHPRRCSCSLATPTAPGSS